MQRFFTISFLLLGITFLAQAQGTLPDLAQTQTLRGRVLDLTSRFPLPGATVMVLNSNPLLGAVADDKGYFKINNVPLGRQTIKCSYTGYQEAIIPNVLLTSAKEFILDFSLQEKITTSAEVEVVAEKNAAKGEVRNEMALVSARTFNVEETRRYAGSRNDPSRMAANFAGVMANNDDRNDIVIRGNSPLGVLWRMEGADIPNPSHFGAVGATGGPVSMLNNNVLASSDFLTSAFPAEYGNALSGVFDLSMRNGNEEKREYTGQVGFNGFELGAEGPFRKGKRSSFLINARYSNLRTFNALGIPIGTGAAIPDYRDLTFKLNFLIGQNSRLTLWGIGGNSRIAFKGKDADTTNFYSGARQDLTYATSMGVTGLNFMHFFSPKTYGRLVISASLSRVRAEQDSLKPDFSKANDDFEDRTDYTRVSARYFISHKFSARSALTGGIYADRLGVDQDTKAFTYLPDRSTFMRPLFQVNANTYLIQAFSQYQYRFTEKLSATVGLHYQRLTLNGSALLAPRAAIKYEITASTSLNVGYGTLGQTQPLSTYFYKTRFLDGAYTETNRNIGLTQSRQWVAGINQALGSVARIKIEGYFQQLSKVPIENRKNSTESLLNAGANFGYVEIDSLKNQGKGQNYGLEITLERFFSKGYYFLVTNSLFESKYQGGDGIWRNTAFNNQWVLNILAGKEFKTGTKSVLGIDIRATGAGGRRYTPILVAESKQQGRAVLDNANPFSRQFANYFRLDIKFSYRLNGKKVMQEWFVDLQNITNRQNVFGQSWDAEKQRIATTYQLGLFPVINYRINF